MQKIQVFIISWVNQHEKAVYISDKLLSQGYNVTIIFSDPNPDLTLKTDATSIRRPNDLFFADKFSACLENFHADIMFVIHADCDCENWSELLRCCQTTMSKSPKIGVWAPLIDGTHFTLEKITIAQVEDSSLHIVSNPDAIVFALSYPIIKRLKKVEDFTQDIYGWAICELFCATSFVNNLLVVVDTAHQVKHHEGSGYTHALASNQKLRFIEKQFTLDEKVAFSLLNTFCSSEKMMNMSV